MPKNVRRQEVSVWMPIPTLKARVQLLKVPFDAAKEEEDDDDDDDDFCCC